MKLRSLSTGGRSQYCRDLTSLSTETKSNKIQCRCFKGRSVTDGALDWLIPTSLVFQMYSMLI